MLKMKHAKSYFLYSLISLFSFSLFAQQKNVEFTKENFKEQKAEWKKAVSDIKDGDKFYNEGPLKYKFAIEYYLSANKLNPNNALLNFKIGNCYIYGQNQAKSLHFFEKANQLDPNVSPMIHYMFGWSHHFNLHFDKAIQEYETFKKTLTPKKDQERIIDVNKKIKECGYGKELVKHPVRVFIDDLGEEINTKYPEYAPVISADESVLMLTSRRPNTVGGEIAEEDQQYYEDIYISRKVNGKWSAAANMGKPVNTERHDATIALSPDGQKLYIYNDDNGDGNIYECDQKGDVWSKPDRMNKHVNSPSHESSACLSPDGKTIYLITDRTDLNGLGGHDVYVSHQNKKGKWMDPVNLGPIINTEYDEESGYMHPDGKTFYFASKGHTSMGGFDIFRTSVENGKWATPENIGYPLNTPGDDLDFVLSASGKHGYYSSFNEHGFGEKDIYIVTFLGPEKPVMLNTEDNLIASLAQPVKQIIIEPKVAVTTAKTTILKGVISDALSQKPLEAEIDLIDNTKNEVLATFMSNAKSGKYLVSLPSGKNYGIAVRKTDYLFHSENFDLPADAAYQEVVKDIHLKNIAVGSKIVLRNIFFDFDKFTLRPESTAELERLIKLLMDVPSMRIELSGHTDSKGSAVYNQKLSENRAKAVVEYLVQHGIDGKRLEYKGFGMDQPMADNKTDEGRQLNRRTEFKILSK